MERKLITSALLYINGLPHLGHIIGCLMPSDLYARFCRAMGHEVLYVCGTDEHGAAVEIAAKQAGVDIKEYCTNYFNQHKEIYEGFNLSYDYLGRSSLEPSKEMTYRIYEHLDKNGFIVEKTMKQVFSIDDNMFLADRYIYGTCPFCGYDNARGDQCEKCTKVLDPTDLINPKSSISNSSNIEVRETKHLFLDLPKAEPMLKEWLKTKAGVWSDVAYSIAQKWLKEGLQERCITRDLKWGFPVPREGFEDKVFYVWFDAPIGYIGITKQWADETGNKWEDWWLNADDVNYAQFMGKDNVPYHSISFPATLLGAGENWTKVDTLKGLSYLTFEGGKFSKSANRGIFAKEALQEFDADYWRYWLMANAPESSDTEFTFDGFAGVVNKDLNGVLGNFVSRVLKMTASKLGAEVPEISTEITDVETQLFDNLQKRIDGYIEHMEKCEIRKAMSELRAMWVEGNNYISTTEPWAVIKVDENRAKTILNICINLIRVFAIFTAQIMPKTAEKMMAQLGLDVGYNIRDFNVSKEILTLPAGHKFEVGAPLFERISDERIVELKEKYGA